MSRVIFFTGGDQMRITSQIGDSPVYRCMQEIYEQGGVIVGTSAGAAAMSGTMLINGQGNQSLELSSMGMAPGLALLPNAVIDSHFAERGRIGRLVAAVAQNPKNLGIGIDENTAIIVERGEGFKVIGSGAVYIVDGIEVSYSSLSNKRAEGIISVHDLKLHVIASGDRYDLAKRRPILPDPQEEE